MSREKRYIGMAIMFALLFAGISLQTAVANNMKVTNTVLSAGDLTYVFVQTDISWDHSWRASWPEGPSTVTNWDAAWIFVKYRYAGGEWHHASLGTTNGNHLASAGCTINVGLSTNTGGTNFGAGVFLYRSGEGSGSWTNTVKLRWNYAQDGLTRTSHVDVCVHAIEMVYVPQGSFYVGDGVATGLAGNFEDATNGTPFLVTNDNCEITLGGGSVGSLGNNNASGMWVLDDFNDITDKTLPAVFPKGYNAFYCMKYEISQGQYADFLNQLIPAQAGYRYPTSNGVFRYTISSNVNVYAADAPDRACNWISWADGAAYTDWAGLRPMTDLEFEKACRGPAAPVAREYAWGSTTIIDTTNFVGTDGSGMETVYPANCNYNNNDVFGPVRCGIYATSVSGRTDAGATYWGIMEMSGNLTEKIVAVGNATGRLFTGATGDGNLDSNGNANVGFWPGNNAVGSGTRGGDWVIIPMHLAVSMRGGAAYGFNGVRNQAYGFRAVRQAP